MLTEIRKNAAYRCTTWRADVRRGSEEEVGGGGEVGLRRQATLRPRKSFGPRAHPHARTLSHTHRLATHTLARTHPLRGRLNFWIFCTNQWDYMVSTTYFPPPVSSFLRSARSRATPKGLALQPIGLERARGERAKVGGAKFLTARCGAESRCGEKKRASPSKSEHGTHASERERRRRRFMTFWRLFCSKFLQWTIFLDTKNDFLELKTENIDWQSREVDQETNNSTWEEICDVILRPSCDFGDCLKSFAEKNI